MKKLFVLLLAVSMVIPVSACTDDLFGLASTETEPSEEESSGPEYRIEELPIQNCVITLGENNDSAAVMASLSGHCEGDITDKNMIFEDPKDNFLMDRIPGLLSSGVDLLVEDLKYPKLTIEYDSSKLNGVPEENILVVCYDETNSEYSVVEDVLMIADYDYLVVDIQYGKYGYAAGFHSIRPCNSNHRSRQAHKG